MIATQFCVMGMGFLDTAMAGRYSATDLAGVSLGSALFWTVFILVSGPLMALTPIVSQLRGEGAVKDAGAVVRQALWLALAGSLIGLGILGWVPELLRTMEVDPAAAAIAAEYLRAASLGFVPLLVYTTLRYVCEALGHTLPPMVIALTALVLNGVLNYVLIYGKWGAPELGGVGCGWATAAVITFQCLLMLTQIWQPYFKATQILRRFDWPDFRQWWRILKIGVPVGVTVALEMSIFTVMAVLIGRLGVVEIAANSIVGNINWATFVIPMSIGAAGGIRVGFYVGARDFAAARLVVATAMKLSLAYALAVSAGLILARGLIVQIYSNDPAVIELAATLVIFVAIYQIFDDAQATAVAALRGYKDTKWPMVYSLVGYWGLALPVGAIFAFGWLGMPAYGIYAFWAALTLGLGLVAVCVSIRLWRTARNDARALALAAT